MKVFTLLSFRVRWKLGAEPVPLLAGEHRNLCSEDVSLVIPAECWEQGEHSYLSHWVMVLAPVPAEKWSSAAQEPVSMWPGRDAGNPATKLTAVQALQFTYSTVLKSAETASVPSCPFFVSGNLISSWRDQCSDDEKPLSLHGAVWDGSRWNLPESKKTWPPTRSKLPSFGFLCRLQLSCWCPFQNQSPLLWQPVSGTTAASWRGVKQAGTSYLAFSQWKVTFSFYDRIHLGY